VSAASLHGHVILRWLAEQPMEAGALRERVDRELGAAVSFHTCDRSGLSFDALLGLLAERGKIVREGEAWRSEMSQVCADE
jgi:probable metal-binding protein